MRLLSLVVIALMGLTMSGCDRSGAPTSSVQIEEVVRTTSAPVDALTRQVVGDAVRVELMCPPDADPSAWRPDPETVALFQRARLIVSNGAGYEAWVETAPLPRSRLVEAADGLSETLITVQGETHSHGPEGHHTHEVTLGQVWLDPVHAIEQAETIAKGLNQAFPEHADTFNVNLEELRTELIGLHERVQQLDTNGVEVMVPSTPYAYLAQRYGWRRIELAEDPERWSMDLYALAMSGSDHGSGTRVLVCESVPDQAIVDELLGSHRVYLLPWPIGFGSDEGTFTGMLRGQVEQLEALLGSIDQARSSDASPP